MRPSHGETRSVSTLETRTGARLLYVLRHAKSSWDDPTLDDRDRPLAPRGWRDAQRLAGFLQRESVAPALVLCSSSLRTRQTLAAILPSLEGDIRVLIEDGLYGAAVEQLLERLRALPDSVPSVMLIGHNPGLQELVLRLARPESELGRLKKNLPTSTLITLALTRVRWRQLAETEQELVGWVEARHLDS
jgi:phosphohistidine phosphatase